MKDQHKKEPSYVCISCGKTKTSGSQGTCCGEPMHEQCPDCKHAHKNNDKPCDCGCK